MTRFGEPSTKREMAHKLVGMVQTSFVEDVEKDERGDGAK
jgi:hypothetical protein